LSRSLNSGRPKIKQRAIQLLLTYSLPSQPSQLIRTSRGASYAKLGLASTPELSPASLTNKQQRLAVFIYVAQPDIPTFSPVPITCGFRTPLLLEHHRFRVNQLCTNSPEAFWNGKPIKG